MLQQNLQHGFPNHLKSKEKPRLVALPGVYIAPAKYGYSAASARTGAA